MKLIVAFITLCCCLQVWGQDKFPDGKLIPDWFRNNESVNINSLGKQYRITDYGVVNDSAKLQTEQIQNVIDRAAKNGGGVIVIPKGTFLSGSLFFKPKTHLYLEENAVLKGSDDAGDFRIQLTRMEGQTVKYYTALINADGIDGFTILYICYSYYIYTYYLWIFINRYIWYSLWAYGSRYNGCYCLFYRYVFIWTRGILSRLYHI